MNSSLSRAALRLHEKLTGRRILERLEELNRTQWMSRDELLALQRDKLQRLVEYAYQYVPYYRRTFDGAGFHPEDLQKDLSYLLKLPILTKAKIRENFQDMITTEQKLRRGMSSLSTSGSTGQPLVFMQDSNYRDYVTADIQRHIGWVGWKLGDLQAVIWGRSGDRSFKQRIRANLINWIWNRFQLNAFEMTEGKMTAFSERADRQRPRILFGYPSSINTFAEFVSKNPSYNIRFNGIFTTAEVLLPHIRSSIEETLGGKVFNRYGTLELGGIACECAEHSGLHISIENNYIEILHNELPAAPGETGDIIVTNFNNYGLPFIRYSIGDTGGWDEGKTCPCGRASPMLKNIEGRTVEMFKTLDGRTIRTTGFSCMNHPAIKQFQIVQKALDKLIVRLALCGELPQSTEDEIIHVFQDTFGKNVSVDLEFLDKIPSLPSGKYQYALSELNRNSNE